MCITLNFLQFHSTPTELRNSPVRQCQHSQGRGHQLSLLPISKCLAISSYSQLESAGYTGIQRKRKVARREIRWIL